MASRYIKTLTSSLEREKDWENKYKLLQEFESRLNSDNFKLSSDDVSFIAYTYCDQILDLRSTLLKQACQTVVAMVKKSLYIYIYIQFQY